MTILFRTADAYLDGLARIRKNSKNTTETLFLIYKILTNDIFWSFNSCSDEYGAMKMPSEAAKKLEQVQKYSISFRRLFRFLFVLVVLALVVQTILIVTGAEPYDTSVRIGHTEYSGDSIPRSIRAIAWIGVVLGSVVLLKLNFHLIKLFGLYADGKLFNSENVYHIRQIGITVLLFPALWVLGAIVPGFLPAEAVARDAVGSGHDPYTELIVGAIIIVLAWIMDVGRELREEQDLVI
jgi:hypothetical protein